MDSFYLQGVALLMKTLSNASSFPTVLICSFYCCRFVAVDSLYKTTLLLIFYIYLFAAMAF